MRKLRPADLRLLDRVNRLTRASTDELREKGQSWNRASLMLMYFRKHGLVDVVVNPVTGKFACGEGGGPKYKITAAGLQALNPTVADHE